MVPAVKEAPSADKQALKPQQEMGERALERKMIDVFETDNPSVKEMDSWHVLSEAEQAEYARIEMEVLLMESLQHDYSKEGVEKYTRLESNDPEIAFSDEEVYDMYMGARQQQEEMISIYRDERPLEAEQTNERHFLYERAREFMVQEIKESPRENMAKGGYMRANTPRVEAEFHEERLTDKEPQFKGLNPQTNFAKKTSNQDKVFDMVREAQDIAMKQAPNIQGVQARIAKDKYLEMEYNEFLEQQGDRQLLFSYKRSKVKLEPRKGELEAERKAAQESQEQIDRIRLAEQGTGAVKEGKGGWQKTA